MELGIMKSVGDNCTSAIKMHAPEILSAIGVVGVVATVVTACKATTKASKVLADANEELEKVSIVESRTDISEEVYSKEDAVKDKAMIYTHAAKDLIVLYAPAALLGTASIGCFLMSNHILNKRGAAIAAAYGALDAAFKEYRERIVKEFGEDVDRRMRYGLRAEKLSETVTDDDGKVSKKKVEVDVLDEDAPHYSCYARVFDDANPNWENNAEYNWMFIMAQQEAINNKLRARGKNGIVTLNEAYEMLGFKPTQAGQVVGWRYCPDDPSHEGNNYIDFGLFDIRSAAKRDFQNGLEKMVYLDFNVDGVILNYMPEKYDDQDRLPNEVIA